MHSAEMFPVEVDIFPHLTCVCRYTITCSKWSMHLMFRQALDCTSFLWFSNVLSEADEDGGWMKIFSDSQCLTSLDPLISLDLISLFSFCYGAQMWTNATTTTYAYGDSASTLMALSCACVRLALNLVLIQLTVMVRKLDTLLSLFWNVLS